MRLTRLAALALFLLLPAAQAPEPPRTCARPDMTDVEARAILESFSIDQFTTLQQVPEAAAIVATAIAAECVMRQWPADLPPRELTRAALAASAALLRLSEARRLGNTRDLSLIPNVQAVMTYIDMVDRRIVGDEVWAAAQMMRFEMVSGVLRDITASLSQEVETAPLFAEARSAIDDALTEPVLATPQNRPILWRHRARTHWLRNALLPGVSVSAAVADYQRAVQGFVDAGQREVALETALESIDLIVSFDGSPQAGVTALQDLEARFSAAELQRRGVFEQRMSVAYRARRPTDLVAASRSWFEALKNDLRATGAPLWAVDSRLHQLFLVAPALLETPDVPEGFARMEELATLSRAGEFELRSFVLPQLPAPPPGQAGPRALAGGLDITRAAALERLGVDAILMPVWVAELSSSNLRAVMTGAGTAAATPLHWLSVLPADRANGETRRSVIEVPFRAEMLVLNEYRRALSSMLPAFVDLLDTQINAEQRATIRQGLIAAAERQAAAADEAFDAAFGRAIDSALGNHCSRADGSDPRVRRVLLILPTSLDFYPVHLARAAGGRPLIDCYEFRRAPDLASALRTADARRERGPVRRIVGIWNPTGGMEQAAAERALIVSAAGPAGVEVRDAVAGSTASLLRPDPAADIVHIAAHGRVGWLDPFRAGFSLANGTSLRVIDLLNGHETTSAGLVVLPACESGLTSPVFGEFGRFGIPAGLLEAGAGGVVTTLWEVRDDATALVMARFYDLLLGEHLQPAAALRQAQLWLRDQGTDEIVDYLLAKEAAAPTGERERIAMLRTAVVFNAASANRAAPYSDPMLWGGFAYFGTYPG